MKTENEANAALQIGKTMNKKYFAAAEQLISLFMNVLDIGDCLRAIVLVCVWQHLRNKDSIVIHEEYTKKLDSIKRKK